MSSCLPKESICPVRSTALTSDVLCVSASKSSSCFTAVVVPHLLVTEANEYTVLLTGANGANYRSFFCRVVACQLWFVDTCKSQTLGFFRSTRHTAKILKSRNTYVKVFAGDIGLEKNGLKHRGVIQTAVLTRPP